MKTLKISLLVAVLLAQFASTDVGRTQISQSLRIRIPKPDPAKYRSIHDGRDWKNPYLVVRRDGIEIVGIIPAGQAIDVDSVPAALQKLPDSAWPYGMVVVVQDIGIISSMAEVPLIAANRTKLLKLLKELGIAVDLWTSA